MIRGFLFMKVAGFLLMLAGWAIVMAAVILLRSGAACGSFVLAGIGVEALGLVVLVRAHVVPRRQQE
jgi:hypothetical protein